MAGQTEETMDTQMEQVPSDPWAMAFAALDKEESQDAEGAVADGGVGPGGTAVDNEGQVPDTEGDDGSQGSAEDEVRHGIGAEVQLGGPDNIGGEDGGEDDDLDWYGTDLSQEQVESYRKEFNDDIRLRALRDVARAYIDKGARHTNGKLGATINDPDVCKRDRDGVPRFYNPETGREFTGDNPRRQAQEWVDDYNRELADAFNATCAEYEKKLMTQEGGRLAIIEFAPKYKALDPVRRSMFDSIIEDYEVRNKDDEVVGYTCDLDKALAAVNRQVRIIQQRFSKAGQAQRNEPSGPALDTPSTTPAGQGGRPNFKSVEEAMEWEQDRLLEQMRNKKGGR